MSRRLRLPRLRRRGRILAVRPGLNPNSSSLGVDVTFLLFGAAALALLTPIVGALVRMSKPVSELELERERERDQDQGLGQDQDQDQEPEPEPEPE